MSQLPTASQSNAKTSSDDQAVDRSQPPSTSSEAFGRISSVPHIRTGQSRVESLPPVQSIQDQASQSSGASARFHYILNPSDPLDYGTVQRDPQRAFVQSSRARELSPEATGGYREEPQPRHSGRLSSTLSSPQSFRGSINVGHGQDQRFDSAQSYTQQVSRATGTTTPSLYRSTSAFHATYPPRPGHPSQTTQSPSLVHPGYGPPNLPSPAAHLSGYHDSQYPVGSHVPVSDASPRQIPSGESSDAVPLPEQRSYHMTLETEQGQIPIRVDVEGASRVADEKRRRNASASARFRARRKEKEHANSQEIEDLKREIYELTEDADFYRQERDYLAAAVLRTPQGDRHFPRPPSPRHRRASQFRESSVPSPGIGPSRYDTYQEQGERGREGRHTRRRISSETQYLTSRVPSPGIGASRYDTYQEQGERGREGRHTRRRISTETPYLSSPIPAAATAYPSQQSYDQQAYGQSIQTRLPSSGQQPPTSTYLSYEPPQTQQPYLPRLKPYIYPSEGEAKPP